MNETQTNTNDNTNTQQDTISLQVVNDNIISLNNNIVSIGITIIFLISIVIGISLQQLQKIEQGKILLKDVKYKTVETLYYLLCPEGINIHDFVEDNDWAIIWDKAKKES